MRRARLPTVALLALAAGACSQQQKPQQDPNVVATVNGDVISRRDFEQELAREAAAMEGVAARTPEQIEPYKQTLLDTLVERLLLLQAARAANITVTAEETDRRVLALASEYPAGTFDDALAQSQTSRAELTRKTSEQLTIEKLFQEQVFSRVAVTEEQIRVYFEEHAEELQEPEQVHAQQIVVKGLDDAKRVQQLLSQGKKFGDLARRFSLSPDARVGGDLGFYRKGEMPPPFDEVFRLSVGQLSDIVTSDYGFHLFKLLEKKPARRRELAEVRVSIEQRLLAKLRAERQKDYVKALRQKAEVKIHDAVIPTVTGRALPAHAGEP